jgi:hypothetical protein
MLKLGLTATAPVAATTVVDDLELGLDCSDLALGPKLGLELGLVQELSLGFGIDVSFKELLLVLSPGRTSRAAVALIIAVVSSPLSAELMIENAGEA